MKSAAELIPLATEDMLGTGFLMTKDPSDNLILKVILRHAKAHPDDDKVFLSGNTKDFDLPHVRAELANAGIRFFRNTKSPLDWYNSL